MELSKRMLGIGYLLGTGLGLSVLFLIKLLLVPSADLLNHSSTVSGMLLALTLIYAGYWLEESDLDGEQVWTVAQWSALGVAVLTVVSVALYLMNQLTAPPSYWRTYLVVSNIGAGGVVGALLGGIKVLRAEHRRVRQLHQRNGVMNRVLRHNIRNEMNVVLGHVDNLGDVVPDEHADSVETVRNSVQAVLNLSETAREVSTLLDRPPEARPVDLGEVVTDAVEAARRDYPEVRFEVETPRRAWIKAGEGVELLVEELIENAAKHNTGDVAVSCVVSETASGDYALRVEDNGSGIDERELQALQTPVETPIVHGSGMGLHLVTWLAEIYDASLDITSDTFGTVVELRLPRANRAGAAADSPEERRDPLIFGTGQHH